MFEVLELRRPTLLTPPFSFVFPFSSDKARFILFFKVTSIILPRTRKKIQINPLTRTVSSLPEAQIFKNYVLESTNYSQHRKAIIFLEHYFMQQKA